MGNDGGGSFKSLSELFREVYKDKLETLLCHANGPIGFSLIRKKELLKKYPVRKSCRCPIFEEKCLCGACDE